ncbi:MAG: MFS transporter, partial [Candidatus Rokuibacteriota bacterium]
MPAIAATVTPQSRPGVETPASHAAASPWFVLALLSVAVLLGMSVWFTASATSAQLRNVWALTPSQAGWLTTTVQLGFVAGTAIAAILN